MLFDELFDGFFCFLFFLELLYFYLLVCYCLNGVKYLKLLYQSGHFFD